MNTLEAIRTKRSVRKFADHQVGDEVIRQILQAGRHSQSSKNDQPWTFILVRAKERLKSLSECGLHSGHIAGAAFAVVIADHADWSFDIGQAAAYMQLGAWDLGIASCLAYFQNQAKLKTLLGIPDEIGAEIGISFGYSAEGKRVPNQGGRKPLEEMLRNESW